MKHERMGQIDLENIKTEHFFPIETKKRSDFNHIKHVTIEKIKYDTPS